MRARFPTNSQCDGCASCSATHGRVCVPRPADGCIRGSAAVPELNGGFKPLFLALSPSPPLSSVSVTLCVVSAHHRFSVRTASVMSLFVVQNCANANCLVCLSVLNIFLNSLLDVSEIPRINQPPCAKTHGIESCFLI